MTIADLLEQQGAALDAGDVAEARKLLEEIKEELDKRRAWGWLRTNQPESYEQLIEKLTRAKDSLNPSGTQRELGQLIRIFDWCGDHGIALDDLRVPSNYMQERQCVLQCREPVCPRHLQEEPTREFQTTCNGCGRGDGRYRHSAVAAE